MEPAENVNLTEEQIEEYLAAPTLCPFCKSPEIEGHSWEAGETASQEMLCLECGFEWQDIYVLSSITW